MTVQILLSKDDPVLAQDTAEFTKQKSRVMKGAKEARWNNKYMKIIEKPVKQIEQAENLMDIQIVIVALLKSLKNIYDNSNFYKEARIVSFVDRLLDCIKLKLQKKFSLQQSVQMGLKDYKTFCEQIDSGKTIIQKFKDNFFILQIIENEETNKVENFYGIKKEEEKKYDENLD